MLIAVAMGWRAGSEKSFVTIAVCLRWPRSPSPLWLLGVLKLPKPPNNNKMFAISVIIVAVAMQRHP